MAVNYSMSYQLSKIRTIGAIPNNNPNYTDEKLTLVCSDELTSTVVPMIMNLRQEYFVDHTDISITSLQTTTLFDIPHDAIFMKIRDLSLCSYATDGSLQQISVPQLSQESISSLSSSNSVYTIFGFIFRDNQIEFYPGRNVNDVQFLRLYYYKRPLELIAVQKAGQITHINGNTLTMSRIPAEWQSGVVLSGVSSVPGFKNRGEYTISSVSTPTIIVSDATGLQVGDWMAVEGYSPIPQIPTEAMPFLQQCTILRVHESMGDQKQIELSLLKKQELQRVLEQSITPRSTGSRQVITNNYSLSRRRW